MRNMFRERPQRRTRGRALAGSILIMTLGAVLSGCAGASSGGGSTQGSNAIKGSITFQTIQLKPTFTTYINSVIAGFEKKYPGTHVNWVDVPETDVNAKIAAEASSNTLPDVVNLNPTQLYPLAVNNVWDNMNTAATSVKASYLAGAWNSFKVPSNGQVVALPWYVTTDSDMYNGADFTAAGLNPAVAPTTFQQLWQDALTITQKTHKYALDAEPDLIADVMARYGIQLVSDNGKQAVFDTPKAVQLFTEMRQLYKEGVINPDSVIGNQTLEIQDYSAGKIAIFPTSGPQFLTIIKQNSETVYNDTRVGPEITQSPYGDLQVMGLAVPKTSHNPATALAFAEYMTNAANQLAFSKIVTIFPSVTSALHNPYFTNAGGDTPEDLSRPIIAKQLPTAEPELPMSVSASFTNPIESAYQAVLTGKAQPAAALAQAEQQCTQSLQQS